MRIIAGSRRGLHLADVGKGDKAAHLRPTTDRLRETVFNLLQNPAYGDPLRDAVVLDLFAGTGALGLEALSRGAQSAMFVDQGRISLDLIAKNIDRCRFGSEARVVKRDATRALPAVEPGFSLAFLDPPYGQGLGEQALAAQSRAGILRKKALLVWEENTEKDAPVGFRLLDRRRYGDSWVHILTVEAR